MKYFWPLILFLCVNMAFAQSLITKVIDLHYRQASEVTPVLNPLLQPGESITGTGNSLVVNVSPDTLTKIRTVLNKLDTPPVTFEISVHQGAANWLKNQNDAAETYGTTSNYVAGNDQSVRVSNGESAMISTGSTRPVLSSVSGGIWPGVSYDQQALQQGFLIEPTLQGKNVKIKIHQVRGQANLMNQEQTNDAQLDTTTVVPLDEWVTLGSAERAPTDSEEDSVTYGAGETNSNDSTLFIKIRLIK